MKRGTALDRVLPRRRRRACSACGGTIRRYPAPSGGRRGQWDYECDGCGVLTQAEVQAR